MALGSTFTAMSARCQEQEPRGWVKQQRHGEDEPPQDRPVGLAEIGLDNATLALHSGPLDPQVGEGLCLDGEFVGKGVALGLPSSAACTNAPTLLAELQNVSSCRRTGPIHG
jgi:hypothetical protein